MSDKDDDQSVIPFLDPIKSAAQRSRTVAYVLILLTVYTLCGFRDFITPNWNSKRLALMTEVDTCFRNKTNSSRCSAVTNIYKGSSYTVINETGGYLGDNDIRAKDFEARLSESVKSEIDHVSFSIPFFGPWLDGNDLWIVSGPITLVVFLLFLAHLEKELGGLEIAKKYCLTAHDRHLLLSSQVLSALQSKTKLGTFIRRAIFLTCYLVPGVLNLFIAKDFVVKFEPIVLPLTNYETEANIEWVIVVASVPALLYVSLRCYYYGYLLEQKVAEIAG